VRSTNFSWKGCMDPVLHMVRNWPPVMTHGFGIPREDSLLAAGQGRPEGHLWIRAWN
jgi:hypothetical protein